MATFRSQELRDRVSAASVSQERPSSSGGVLGHSRAATPMTPVEVPPVEVPSSAEVVPAVEVPPSAQILVLASEEVTNTVGSSEDSNFRGLGGLH